MSILRKIKKAIKSEIKSFNIMKSEINEVDEDIVNVMKATLDSYPKQWHTDIASKRDSVLEEVVKEIEIYDGLIGVVKAYRGEMDGIKYEPRQKDLLGAKIRLAVGEDNTVFVRAISVIRKGKDFKGDECPVFHTAKINIQKPEKEYLFEPILK